jgi:O-antigen/teichoic acid export membrane protein
MLERIIHNGRLLSQKIVIFTRAQTKDPRFWRESSLLILANVTVTALGLVRTPLITWTIPKEEVGMLGVVASWMPFLQILSLTGLDIASFHYTSKGKAWAFMVNISYRLRWSLLSMVGFFAGAFYWFIHAESDLAWLFIVAGITFPLSSGLSAVAGTIGALEQYQSLFWYRIWESLTDFTGFIPLIFSIWWVNKIVTFYGTNQLATMVMMVGYSVWLFKLLKKNPGNRLNKIDEEEMIKYGKSQTGINSISVINNRIDAILVSIFLPLNTMADYSIALLVYEQLRRLWNIYITIRYPKLVRISFKRLWQQFIVEGAVVFSGFVIVGFVIAGLGFWLIPIILPPSYATSLRYIFLLILAFIAGVPAGISETFFRTQQDPQPQFFLRLVGVTASIIASVILLPMWGAVGVAAGRIFASMAQSIVGAVLFLQYRQRYKENEKTDQNA